MVLAYRVHQNQHGTGKSSCLSHAKRYPPDFFLVVNCPIPFVTSQDLRRHFPANFRRALNLDEVNPATALHGPFSSLLTRLGLDVPIPPSPRSQPTFVSPRRGHRHSRARSSPGSFHDDTSLDRSTNCGSADDARRRQRHTRRVLSMSMPCRPSRGDKQATPGGQGRLGLTAPAGIKAELHR